MLTVPKILLAVESKSFTDKIVAIAQTTQDIQICGVLHSGAGLMDAIRSEHPDLILLDYMIPDVTFLTILHQINLMSPEDRPAVYALLPLSSAEIEAECERLGVRFLLRKPVEEAIIVDLLARYGLRSRCAVSQRDLKPSRIDVSQRIVQILNTCSIPTHVSGYRFLRQSILATLENPELGESVTKRLYPHIARLNSTSWSNVERDMRNAIALGWKRSNNRMAGFGKSRRPTNREFIMDIVERIRHEMNIPDDLSEMEEDPDFFI